MKCPSVLSASRVLFLALCLGVFCFFGGCSEKTAPREPVENEPVMGQPPQPQSLDEKAQALLSEMSLEEKVGQLFIARCPEENAAQKAADFHLGGYLLFGRDFKDRSRQEIVQTIQSYQNAAHIPLLIGVDEEGGTVNRVSLNPTLRETPFLSAQQLYAQGGWERIQSDTAEKCELLKSLGIHLNFAPVCDVSCDEKDFIYKRSFGQDAAATADYVKIVVETMHSKGLGSVLKHFPGYGDNADTHTGIVYDERAWETFETADFLPFAAGIDAGADVVLVSHNIVSCMDAARPASLSPRVHEILRQELGFSGVIVTDDLAMDGIGDFAPDDEAAVQAVLAGNDLLCCSDFETQLPAVREAARSGEIPRSRIDEAVRRVLKLKISLGLIEAD